ncbi:MAG: exodeoxyribonuclease VII large subunit [Flavobacteriales bacterium]|nr:exodeoxyribonuclease VII large subunit [Flavobacteriales bacterium]
MVTELPWNRYIRVVDDQQKIVTLSTVNDYIGRLLGKRLGGKHFWLRVEIASIKFPPSGHAYVELVENQGSAVIARSSATIWREPLNAIKEALGKEFEEVLKTGSEILCLAEVTYHPVYGIKMSIHAVDLSFSLGELERKRQETLDRLTKEGLIGTNKECPLPLVPQKLIVIAAPDSAGYEDFVKQLRHNQYGYAFSVHLLTTLVQGEAAKSKIATRVEEAYELEGDAVIIIRGGGSKLDLAVFNEYDVARAIALCPKPVITGIGHDQDVSVSDVVAHSMLKTPSAVGAFLVERLANFEGTIRETYGRIRIVYKLAVADKRALLSGARKDLESLSISYTRNRSAAIQHLANAVVRNSRNCTQNRVLKLKSDRDSLKALQKRCMMQARHKLEAHKNHLADAMQTSLRNHQFKLEQQKRTLTQRTRTILTMERNELVHLEQVMKSLSPERTLKRGFGIVKNQQGLVTAKTVLRKGEELEIELYRKKLVVAYKSVKKNG